MSEEINVKILDVNPFDGPYNECPNEYCDSQEIVYVLSGPLSDWTKCDKCECHFSPAVEFKEME